MTHHAVHRPTPPSDPGAGRRPGRGWRARERRGRRRAHLALSTRVGRAFWEHLDDTELERLQLDHEEAAADIADMLRRRAR
jgi:hypothetical protein